MTCDHRRTFAVNSDAADNASQLGEFRMNLDVLRSRVWSAIVGGVHPYGFVSSKPGIFERRDADNGLRNRIMVPIDVPDIEGPLSCTVNLLVGPAELVSFARPAREPRGSQSICVNIGTLMPIERRLAWELTDDEGQTRVLAEIASSIEAYALPWFDGFAGVDDVLKAIRAKRFINHRPALRNALSGPKRSKLKRPSVSTA
jgi:hypothetical protein